MAEEGKFHAQDRIQTRLVRGIDRDEAFALLLIKLLFLEHADFVFRGIHAPVLEIDIEFREIEIGTHGVAAENPEALVVAIGEVAGGQPVGDQAFAVGLHRGTRFGDDRLVEFDFGIEVPALEEHLVEACVAKGALESLLAPSVFVRRGFAAAPNALVPGAVLFEADGIANGFGGRMGGAADVVFDPRILSQIVQVVQMVAGGGAVGLESFQRVLPRLWMRVTQGDGEQCLHRDPASAPKAASLPMAEAARRRISAEGNCSRRTSSDSNGRVSSAAQGQGALCGLVVHFRVQGSFHGVNRVNASAGGRESAERVSQPRVSRFSRVGKPPTRVKQPGRGRLSSRPGSAFGPQASRHWKRKGPLTVMVATPIPL